MFDPLRHGLTLTKKAWGGYRAHSGLVKLPITGGVVGLVAFVVVGAPGVVLLDSDDTWVVVGGIALLLMGACLAGLSVGFSTLRW